MEIHIRIHICMHTYKHTWIGQTVKALRTWMSEANIAPENITFGVRAFLMSDTGGFLFECGSGCRTIRNKLEKKGCEWSHIIGTGNGRIMDMLAALASTEDLKVCTRMHADVHSLVPTCLV